MNRARGATLAIAALAMSAAAALAGEGKCQSSTQECLDYMANKMQNSGWVGVELDETESKVGMKVVAVVPESPAAEAGMKDGDVLTAINGIELNEGNREKLEKARAEWKPGSKVQWTMHRAGSERVVKLTLAPMPADVLARYVGQHMLEHAEVEIAQGG
jgi:C-terminal processing protease CtpA/Prc